MNGHQPKKTCENCCAFYVCTKRIKKHLTTCDEHLPIPPMPQVQKPYATRTNFEKIKDMTVEELAKFIAEPCECEVDPTKDGYIECGNDLCIKRLIKWLNEPSKE